jgi:hypothetical protein
MPVVMKIWPAGRAKALGSGIFTTPKTKGYFWKSDCWASS